MIPIQKKLQNLLLLSGLSLVSALSGCEKDQYSENCFSREILSGAYSNGRCGFSGVLVVSGGTMLLMNEYKPEDARSCLEYGCPSVGYWVEDVSRVSYESCEPSKISGVADFRYLPDGVAMLSNFEPALRSDVVACEFPAGFYTNEPQH